MLVTLPTYQELLAAKVNFELTDFAIATGAIATDVNAAADGTHRYFGEAWLRTMCDDTKMETYADSVIHDKHAKNYYRAVEDNGCCVMPRFENAASRDISTIKLAGQEVLTINGKIPCYPQRRVDLDLEDDLETMRKLGNPQLQLCAPYSIPCGYAPKHKNLKTKLQECYSFLGDKYVRTFGREHLASWYLCEPISATRCEDGSVQCRKMLFASIFDETLHFFDRNNQTGKKTDLCYLGQNKTVKIKDYAIGKFLNEEFMTDLQYSTMPSRRHRQNKLTQLKIGAKLDSTKDKGMANA